MLTLVIGNVLTRIEGLIPEHVKLDIREQCAYSIKGAEFSTMGAATYCPFCKKNTEMLTWEEKRSVPQDGFSYRKCRIHGLVKPISLWDGRKFLFDSRSEKFPTGIISRVVACLKKHNVPYKIVDERIVPYTRRLTWHGPQLRYYQKEAVDMLIKKSRGIIQAVMGSGKSQMIAAMIGEIGVNTVVVAHTTSVFHQLHNTLQKSLCIPVGRVGDGHKDIKKVTVVLPQSIVGTVKVLKRKLVSGRWKDVMANVQVVKDEYKDFLINTEALIVDESHHTPADTVQLVANSCVNAYFRIGLSATPYRADLLDILMESVTGKINYKYTATQAITDGYLAKPRIHFVRFKQKAYPRKKLALVKDSKTHIEVEKLVPVKYADLYTDLVVRNDRRNSLIAHIAKEHFLKNESVLIIVRHLEHGENIYAKLKHLGKTVRWVNGENDTEELKQVLKDLNDGTCRICVASGIFNEGVDVTGLNVCINTTACDSPVTAMQILGRTLRRTTTKTEVDFYDIADYGCRWLGEHASNRKEMYQTEAAFEILDEDENSFDISQSI